MRDLLVLALTAGSVFLGISRPWMGVLALAFFGYLNPHRYAWGFSTTIPVYLMIFLATMVGIFLHPEQKQKFPMKRETITFFFLLAWFTATTFVAPDIPEAAHDQWFKVMKIYIGIFPTFWLINSEDKLKWLIVTIALSFGLIGVKGGIFSLLSGFGHRVQGPDNTFYGGNNEIALALNMMLPLLLLCSRMVKKFLWKYFFFTVFFLCACSIVGTYSRGGLITLVVVMTLLILSSKRKWLAVPLLVIGVMFIIPRLPAEWFGRMDTIETYEQDLSVQERFDAWEYAVDRAVHNPLGGGFETFRINGTDAHSAYFEILGEHGFIGLGLWLTLLIGGVLNLQGIRKKLRNRTDMDDWVMHLPRALQISFFGYAVGGAALGVAYWDIFYHLVGITVIIKVLLSQQLETVPAEAELQPGQGYQQASLS